ncbi:DUF2085 domain-containing protein [Acidobacteriota bacterium]
MTNRQKIFTIYVFSLASLLIWISAIFLAPFLNYFSQKGSEFIYAVFSPVCHQISERCFFVFGFPLAVCTRCLGIYLGCFLGMILYPIIHGFSSTAVPKLKLFFLFTSPIAVDTLGNFFSIWNTTPWLRFTIGFIWGVILPFYFISGLADAFLNKKHLVIPIENKLE